MTQPAFKLDLFGPVQCVILESDLMYYFHNATCSRVLTFSIFLIFLIESPDFRSGMWPSLISWLVIIKTTHFAS